MHFAKTHTRQSDGRYIVRLPFKQQDAVDIGNSRDVAERRLLSLTKRFHRDPLLRTEYSRFLNEYETLQHMRHVPADQPSTVSPIYLPHHPVIKASSVTTKLRVVFDASSRASSGYSLNDRLHSGPKLQNDLPTVLLQWRQHKYVYCADIAKMYRQILIDSRDVDYQRILWVSDDSSVINEYQLLTVTYGTACAPYLALRVLRQLVEDDGDDCPLATSILRDQIYVDDVLFGAEDMPLLLQMRTQLCALLKRGCFELRKWASNRSELLSDISPDNHGLACDKSLQNHDNIALLGLAWSPSQDTFKFKLNLPDTIPTTKRTILSAIAKLFDPLGLVSPVILSAKLIMQHLWRIKIDWDETPPSSCLNKWRVIYTQLSMLNAIAIPR